MSQRPVSRSPVFGELSLYTPSLRSLRISSGSGAVKLNARTESKVARGGRERKWRAEKSFDGQSRTRRRQAGENVRCVDVQKL